MISRKQLSGTIYVKFACGCKSTIGLTYVDDVVEGEDINVYLDAMTPCEKHENLRAPQIDLERLVNDLLNAIDTSYEGLLQYHDGLVAWPTS